MLYSPSNNAFYAPGINPTIPGDAVAVTDTAYAALMAGQTTGSSIQNVAGVPTLVAATPPTKPTNHDAAVTLLAAGLAITSTGTPGINGTYSADAGLLAKYQVLQSGETAGNFPFGFIWAARKTSGTWQNVSNATNFNNIVVALCCFAAACQACIDGVPSAPLPAGTASIA